ncbi:hypothetical protein H0H93_013458 [Arthromyces matolae]|nr:hypothetical protein H0H93_013458 [Arthromyces matolae]
MRQTRRSPDIPIQPRWERREENLPLRSEFDQSTGGTPFGPFNHRVTLQFTIENAQYENGTFRPSRVIAPVTVTRAPTDQHPYHTHVTTVGFFPSPRR